MSPNRSCGLERNLKVARSRNWLVTVNKYTDVDEAHLQSLGVSLSVQYLVYGREVAPSTGHKHLQCFVIFRHAKEFSGVKKFFAGLGNPNLKRGDDKGFKMMEYCKKDGDYWECGTRPESLSSAGRRGGLTKGVNYKRMIEDAENGDLERIKRKVPLMYLRHFSTLKAIAKESAVMPADLDSVTGVWIYGAAGSGKSHYARVEYPGYYDKACNKWWCNYKGESNVLIDDFDRNHEKLAHHLKRWSDRYAFSVEVKHGGQNIRPLKIVVTSQFKIEDIWPDEETRSALNRRFEKVKIHIDSQGNRIVKNFGF